MLWLWCRNTSMQLTAVGCKDTDEWQLRWLQTLPRFGFAVNLWRVSNALSVMHSLQTPSNSCGHDLVPTEWWEVAGRLRVRDINDAIRELGQMVAMHTGASSSTFTKLTVLQEAVRVITDLENRLRGMDCQHRNEQQSEYSGLFSSPACYAWSFISSSGHPVFVVVCDMCFAAWLCIACCMWQLCAEPEIFA